MEVWIERVDEDDEIVHVEAHAADTFSRASRASCPRTRKPSLRSASSRRRVERRQASSAAGLTHANGVVADWRPCRMRMNTH